MAELPDKQIVAGSLDSEGALLKGTRRASKRKLRVLLHCDERRRDAVMIWALSLLLQDRGYKVLISNRSTLNRFGRWFDPDIIILSHCFMGFTPDELAVRSKRARILVMPTEGMLFERTNAIGAYSGAPLEAGGQQRRSYTAHITRFLAWGDVARRLVLDEGIYNEDQVAVVGNPRFDVYRTGYFDELRTQTRKNNVIGLAADLAQLNVFDQRNPLRHFDQVRIKRGDAFDHDREVEDMYWYLYANMRLQFEFTHEFSTSGAGDLWVRPHPLEYAHNYDYLSLPNFHMSDNTEPFYMWLARLQALVVTKSTSVVEGFITGTPVIALQPIHGSRLQDHVKLLDLDLPLLKHCHRPGSVEEAVDMAAKACRGELSGTPLDDEDVSSFLKDYCNWPSQDLTLTQVVKQVDEVAERDTTPLSANGQLAGARAGLLLGAFMGYNLARYCRAGLFSGFEIGRRSEVRFYQMKYNHFFPQWHGWDRREGSKLANYLMQTDTPSSPY